MADERALALTKKAPANMSRFLEMMESRISDVLPRQLSQATERFMRLVGSEASRSPDLAMCTEASLINGLMLAGQLGLEPCSPLGHIYFIPFKNWKNDNRLEVVSIIGYKGYLELARRSGQYSYITANVFYKDEYEKKLITINRDPPDVQYLFDPFVDRSKDEDIVGAYCKAETKDGGVYLEVMNRAELDAVRAGSPAANKGPYVDHLPRMFRKAPIRRLFSGGTAPMDATMQTALSGDEVGFDREDHRTVAAVVADPLTTALTAPDPKPLDTAPINTTAETVDGAPENTEETGELSAIEEYRALLAAPEGSLTPDGIERMEFLYQTQEVQNMLQGIGADDTAPATKPEASTAAPAPPPKPATPPPPPEQPDGRRTRCDRRVGGCGELFGPGLVVGKLCPDCRENKDEAALEHIAGGKDPGYRETTPLEEFRYLRSLREPTAEQRERFKELQSSPEIQAALKGKAPQAAPAAPAPPEPDPPRSNADADPENNQDDRQTEVEPPYDRAIRLRKYYGVPVMDGRTIIWEVCQAPKDSGEWTHKHVDEFEVHFKNYADKVEKERQEEANAEL